MQIGDIFKKCVSFVRVLGITIDSKLNLKTYQQYYKKCILWTICPKKTKKVPNIRKSQNLSLFSDRNSILPVNLDALLEIDIQRVYKVQ